MVLVGLKDQNVAQLEGVLLESVHFECLQLATEKVTARLRTHDIHCDQTVHVIVSGVWDARTWSILLVPFDYPCLQSICLLHCHPLLFQSN